MPVVKAKQKVESIPGVYQAPEGGATLVVEREAQIAACIGNGWKYVGPVPKKKAAPAGSESSTSEAEGLKEQLAKAEAARKEAEEKAADATAKAAKEAEARATAEAATKAATEKAEAARKEADQLKAANK